MTNFSFLNNISIIHNPCFEISTQKFNKELYKQLSSYDNFVFYHIHTGECENVTKIVWVLMCQDCGN
jgi:hypothetical protein